MLRGPVRTGAGDIKDAFRFGTKIQRGYLRIMLIDQNFYELVFF